MATLVAAVGLGGPGALFSARSRCSASPWPISYLNNWRSDAGAAYVGGARARSGAGLLCRLAMLVAQVLFMVVGLLPVADATLDLIAPKATGNVLLVTAIGFVWFLVVVGIVMLGVKTTARFQKGVTYLQIGGLLPLRSRRSSEVRRTRPTIRVGRGCRRRAATVCTASSPARS